MLFLAQDAAGLGGLVQFLPLVLVGVVFWFLILRPQRKAKAEREQMLRQVGVGDEVVTIGGIFGEVEALDDEWVDLLVGDDVVLRMTRGSIGRIASDQELAAIEAFANPGSTASVADPLDEPARDLEGGLGHVDDTDPDAPTDRR